MTPVVPMNPEGAGPCIFVVIAAVIFVDASSLLDYVGTCSLDCGLDRWPICLEAA